MILSVKERPEPYKWRTGIRSIASVVLGTVTALFPTAIAYRLDRNLSLAATLVVYIASAVLLSVAWRVYFDRPEELDTQIPISSKEHRHRKKDFYDWLDTQGRR